MHSTRKDFFKNLIYLLKYQYNYITMPIPPLKQFEYEIAALMQKTKQMR